MKDTGRIGNTADIIVWFETVGKLKEKFLVQGIAKYSKPVVVKQVVADL